LTGREKLGGEAPDSKYKHEMTDVQYFADNRDLLSQCGAQLNDGNISIEDYARQIKISVDFPEGMKWVYEKQSPIEGKYTTCRGAEIRTNTQTLSVYIHEYKTPGIGVPGGNVDLVSSSGTTSIAIPYKLAVNLMNFMEHISK
jgi:hypothetical protein